MQMFSRRFVQVGILIFMAIAIVLPAQAATFSNASLKGSYSFLTNLWTANVSTNQFGMLGVMAFDGAGNVTGSYTSVAWDTVQGGAFSGTYAVGSNGIGTISLTTGLTAQFAITINSTVAKMADGVQLLQTNDSNNEIISGTAVLQSNPAATYNLASLKGNFSLLWNTWTADASLAQDAGTGLISFDGKGNITGSGTSMYQGVAYPTTLTGTYTMNSNGTGIMTLKTNGGGTSEWGFALNAVKADKAKGLQILAPGSSSGNSVATWTALGQ
ncbi:MAG: hypothetical protein ABSG70_09845 [Terriglobales bacterium]